MSGSEKQPEGYDIKAVEGWIKENIEQLNPPLNGPVWKEGIRILLINWRIIGVSRRSLEDLHLANCTKSS